MILEPVLKNPWVRALGLILALTILGLLLYTLSFVLVPLFLAMLVAYILDPLVDFFERRRIPRSVTVAILALLSVTALVMAPLLLINSVMTQAELLREAAMEDHSPSTPLGQRVEQYLESERVTHALTRICEIAGWGDPEKDDFNPKAEIATHISDYVLANVTSLLQVSVGQMIDAGQDAGATLARFVAGTGRIALKTLLFFGNLALFAFVAGYLLKDFDQLINSAKDMVPPAYRQRVFDIVRRIDTQLQGFLRGQLTVCLCLGLMYGIGFVICGAPFGIILAVFGAVVSFVPYLGAALTILPATLLTLLAYGLDWRVIGVILTFAIAQTIETNILTPKIVGGKVGLGPVWVILAVLVFGNLLGFLGLLLAVPIAATLKVLVIEAWVWYKGSSFYKGDTPPSTESQ